MEDQETGVAQEEALNEEPQEPQDESQSVPQSEQESLPDDALKAYEGKSPEELAKMHYGLQKKLGEQGQVIGSLKELVEELRAGRVKQTEPPNPFRSEFQKPQEAAPQQQVSQEDLADDDFLTYGKVKQLLQTKEQQQQQWKMQETASRISVAFDEGKSSMKDDPIFDGIENEVVQYVFEQNRVPFQMFGMDVSPYVRSPQTWRTAAVQIRAQRNEWDKITPPKKSGRVVPLTTTETPSGGTTRTESASASIDVNDREIQDFMDAMEETTGKRPTRADVEEAIKRGSEIWHAKGTLGGRRY